MAISVVLDRQKSYLSLVFVLAAGVCLLIGIRMKPPTDTASVASTASRKALSKQARFLSLGVAVTVGVLAFYFLPVGPSLEPTQRLVICLISWIIGLAIIYWTIHHRKDRA